jgi:hypothetical protein
LKIALARLRERGDREAVGEGFARFARMKQPPASPYPLPLERAVINCDLAVNPNVQTPGPLPRERVDGVRRFHQPARDR